MEHYINLHSNNCDDNKQIFLLSDKLYTLLFVCVIILNEPRHINMINCIASFNNITTNTSRYTLLSIYTKQTIDTKKI